MCLANTGKEERSNIDLEDCLPRQNIMYDLESDKEFMEATSLKFGARSP